jgi:tRNA(Phe) wybutosine-synthesizing methylase Tyw3
LTSYSTTSSSSGRTVAIPNPNNNSRITNNWYSFEGSYGVKTLKSHSEFTVIEKSNGAVVNENGRYWIAVGPKVLNPNTIPQ